MESSTSREGKKCVPFFAFVRSVHVRFLRLLLRSVIFPVTQIVLFIYKWIYLCFLVLSFDCANLYFAKRHPPFYMGGRMKVIDAAVERVYVLRSATPPLLDLRGVDEFLCEISTLVLCSSTFLPWDLRSWRFFVFDFLPWALRSQGLFCLRLLAHKDFYVFEFLPWALGSQGLFCLRLFAHKDFAI